MFETDVIEVFYEEAQVKEIPLIGEIREESYRNLLTFEATDGHCCEFFIKKKSSINKNSICKQLVKNLRALRIKTKRSFCFSKECSASPQWFFNK